MSTILVRYLFQQSLVRSFQMLLLFGVLYTTIDYVETASLVPSHVLNAYYWYKLPQSISHMLPLAFGMAVVLVAHHLQQCGEWTAIEASGRSPVFIAAILCLPAALVTPLGWMLAHEWSPRATAVFEHAVFAETDDSGALSEGDWLVFQSDSTRDKTEIRVRRSSKGRACQLRIRDEKKSNTVQEWHQKQPLTECRTRSHVSGKTSFSPQIVPTVGINGIFASSMSSTQLHKYLRKTDTHNPSVFRVQATVALRSAVAMSIWIVPVLSLFAWWAFRIRSAVRSVFISFSVAGGSWAVFLLWWNLAQAGWLGPGSIWMWLAVGGGGTVGISLVIRSRRR